MSMTINELLVEARTLPFVPLAATTTYKRNVSVLTKHVDDKLSSMSGIHALIGNNPMQVMFDNHKHHAAFMSTVFSIGNYELLCKTVPWVYHAYHSHKFSYDYFPLELKAWQEAIKKHLDNNSVEAIMKIYDWMIDNHEQFAILSESDMTFPMPVNADWLSVKSSFQSSLIAGDHKKCMAIALENVKTAADIETFYGQIIQPVMYEVGMLWEEDVLSVAQEHLASAIVGRVMATISMTTIGAQKKRGKVVVTASPNEFHEIGAWMIADILEHDGWDMHYLGANTPQNDLLQFLLSFRPDILAISITTPFNIEKVKDIVDSIRKDKELEKMKIMVGGRIFNEYPDLWRMMGADGFAVNVEDARKLAQQWGEKEDAN